MSEAGGRGSGCQWVWLCRDDSRLLVVVRGGGSHGCRVATGTWRLHRGGHRMVRSRLGITRVVGLIFSLNVLENFCSPLLARLPDLRASLYESFALF